MTGPQERGKQYLDKFPNGVWPVVADYTNLLPAGVALDTTGHTAVAYDAGGNDVTSSVIDTATLTATSPFLSVMSKQFTPPAMPALYTVVFRAKTTATPPAYEVLPVYVRVTPADQAAGV